MPHEKMDDRQVAAYLHMDLREVQKLAQRGRMPARRVGGEFVFIKSEVDHWVETQMHELAPDRLAKIERGVSRHHGFEHETLLVNELIPPHGIAVPLQAKTRESALRRLIDVADAAEMVYVRDELLNEVRSREDLCSTSMFPGVAMPHPRHPLPYDIAESFVVVGLTPRGIPFGAEDGSLTRLFFLICCKDDRTHLHVLARLAQILHDSRTIDQMMVSETPEELGEVLLDAERSIAEA
jgi:PTS system nitrogen regulatory IIA component